MRKRIAILASVLFALVGISAATAVPANAAWDWSKTASAAPQAWDWSTKAPTAWDWSKSAPNAAQAGTPCDNKVKMCNGVHPVETSQAPSMEPSSSTPVNPKIVKGKAGSGIFDPTAPGYEAADSGLAAAAPSKTQNKTFAVTATPAPYSSLRWATTPEDANGHPWICISNNLGYTIQAEVGYWGIASDQLTYAYQVNGCTGWGNNEKIDVQRGTDASRACAYVYKAWNTSGLLTRVIVYHNQAIRGCYETTNPTAELSVAHWKSQVIGLGLGNLQFGSADWPGWVSVMDMSSVSSNTPRAERNDGLTYDYYN